MLLAKMLFNKSHLSTCMVTRKHFITTKIFPGRDKRGERARAQGAAAPNPSGAAHETQSQTGVIS